MKSNCILILFFSLLLIFFITGCKTKQVTSTAPAIKENSVNINAPSFALPEEENGMNVIAPAVDRCDDEVADSSLVRDSIR